MDETKIAGEVPANDLSAAPAGNPSWDPPRSPPSPAAQPQRQHTVGARVGTRPL